MALSQDDIHICYELLISVLLQAEGHEIILEPHKLNYNQDSRITVPEIFIPLLYAAATSVNMSLAFLPHYLRHFSTDKVLEKPGYVAFIQEFMQKKEHLFMQEVYPDVLKFLLSDSLRTLSGTKLSDIEVQNGRLNLLYDQEKTLYPPCGGINILDFDLDEHSEHLVIIGDMSQDALIYLQEHLKDKLIYGITPEVIPVDDVNINPLEQRLRQFSKTILAGSLNIQLPFIEPFLKAGIGPISFYHYLYRGDQSEKALKNSLCLLHNSPVNEKIYDLLNYQRLPAHTDITAQNETRKNVVNYLQLLCDYT